MVWLAPVLRLSRYYIVHKCQSTSSPYLRFVATAALAVVVVDVFLGWRWWCWHGWGRSTVVNEWPPVATNQLTWAYIGKDWIYWWGWGFSGRSWTQPRIKLEKGRRPLFHLKHKPKNIYQGPAPIRSTPYCLWFASRIFGMSSERVFS